jgi:hypothetical protein
VISATDARATARAFDRTLAAPPRGPGESALIDANGRERRTKNTPALGEARSELRSDRASVRYRMPGPFSRLSNA